MSDSGRVLGDSDDDRERMMRAEQRRNDNMRALGELEMWVSEKKHHRYAICFAPNIDVCLMDGDSRMLTADLDFADPEHVGIGTVIREALRRWRENYDQ